MTKKHFEILADMLVELYTKLDYEPWLLVHNQITNMCLYFNGKFDLNKFNSKINKQIGRKVI